MAVVPLQQQVDAVFRRGLLRRTGFLSLARGN
jgi:hypothetical protein